MAAQISRWWITGTLIGGLLHGPVFAETAVDNQVMVLPEVTETTVSELLGMAAVESDALDANRGGAQVEVLNKNALDGVVSDNHASNLATGSNWVTAGSFTDASGLSTVIQNSGNNVLIQNATVINLQLQ